MRPIAGTVTDPNAFRQEPRRLFTVRLTEAEVFALLDALGPLVGPGDLNAGVPASTAYVQLAKAWDKRRDRGLRDES